MEYHSKDLYDAIDLARVWIDEGDAASIVLHAEYHIGDISQYDLEHDVIGIIKELNSKAIKYLAYNSYAGRIALDTLYKIGD